MSAGNSPGPGFVPDPEEALVAWATIRPRPLLIPGSGSKSCRKGLQFKGFWNFGPASVPPKTPPSKGGCCRTFSDVSKTLL